MHLVSRAAVLAAVLSLSLVLFTAPVAQAQDVQVAFDQTRGVSVIDADLRERLGLFPAVDGFREARLFESAGGTYELVIRYEGEDGRILRERQSLTEEEVAVLRQRVSAALAAAEANRDPRADLEDGRYRFLAATTLVGGYTGAFVGTAISEGGEVSAALPLLGAAGGFFVPLLLTRDGKVTEGEATLTGYGGFQGIAHGVLISVLLGDESIDGRGAALLTGLLSVTEAAAGFGLARRDYMRGGPAEMMSLGGAYGTGLGIATGFLLTLDEEPAQRVVPLAGLAGSVVGAVGGRRLGEWGGYTQGDARIFGAAGLVGAVLSTGIVANLNPSGGNPRLSIGSVIAGTLGGLAVGNSMVRGRDFSEADGSIVSLGAYAGLLAGSAVATLTEPSGESALLLSGLGAVAGFAGTYFTFRDAARPGRTSVRNLDVGIGPGTALPGGNGGPLGAFTPALNVRLGL